MTLSDCESQFSSRLFGLDYVKRGTETIDNAALSRCIEGYKATSLSCAYQPLEVACKGVFVGTKAEGAPCGRGGIPSTSGSGECRATGRATMCLWTGDSNLSTTTGTCQTPAHGKKGDPCASSCAKNDDCIFDLYTSPGYPTAICFEEDGLYCSSGPSSVCATLTPTGGSCDADPLSCASTDFCDHSDAVASCRKGATLGEACGSGRGQPQCLQGMSLSCGTSSTCEDLGLAFETTCRGTPTFP